MKLLEALSDDAISEKYQKIFEKCFKASTEAITELQKTVVILNNELRSREKRIEDLGPFSISLLKLSQLKAKS